MEEVLEFDFSDEPLIVTAKRPVIKASIWETMNMKILLGSMLALFLLGVMRK